MTLRQWLRDYTFKPFYASEQEWKKDFDAFKAALARFWRESRG